MSSKKKLQQALHDELLPGESVVASRPLVANARIDRRRDSSRLALLGPAVFSCTAVGAIASADGMPDGTNLVVMTDRRLLWCRRGHLSHDLTVGGSDFLSTVGRVDVIPARIALAKLRITLHGGDTVQFDLPSDHKADAFAQRINDHISANPSFSPPTSDVSAAA